MATIPKTDRQRFLEAGTSTVTPPLPEFPKLPAEVVKRFPSLAEWELKVEEFFKQRRTGGVV